MASNYDLDWKDQKLDSLGLFVKDAADNLSPAPLKFKSSSDWETVGAKKERWKITTGVGNEKIPIRHADRYAMPAVMVKDFIRKGYRV